MFCGTRTVMRVMGAREGADVTRDSRLVTRSERQGALILIERLEMICVAVPVVRRT